LRIVNLQDLKKQYKTRKEWRNAIDDEIKRINKNDMWELTTLPLGKKTIKVKMGVQDEEECKRRGGEVQRKIDGKMI
jgi:hypothetical protein